MIDYHVHTSLCNHASGFMEQYVKKAIDSGLKEICFTDHFTPSKMGSKNSMVLKEIPLYLQSIQNLRTEYQSAIDVKSGLEIDFDEEWIGLYEEITRKYDFDAVICSLHFLGELNVASRKSKVILEKMDKAEVIESYFAKIEKMISYDFFDIVGHVDILKKTNIITPGLFEKNIKAVIEKISASGLTLELNTSGFSYPFNDSYPSENLLGFCKEKGTLFTIGSDAHKPNETGKMIFHSIKLLKEAGYREIQSFSHRKAVPLSI